MGANTEFYNDSVSSFTELTKKPGKYLERDPSFCQEITASLKKIYDFTKNEEIKRHTSSSLPELIVNDFDLEQIWQQIELQNDPLLSRSLTTVSRLVVGKDRLLFGNLETHVLKDEAENEELSSKADSEDDEQLISESSSESDTQITKDENPTKIKPSIVDDDFFKLDEMERFLNSEEKKLNDPDSGNDSEDSDKESELSVDLFEDNEDDEDEMRTARYKDFFVAQEEPRKKTPRNKFLEEMEADEPISSFEQRQERLSRKIEEIEDEAVSDKPWQLKGEITAENRPQNSLLEEIVEFDLSTRPAPVITEQTTFQLEDIIKQRIKNNAFDSVERKARPVDTPLEYKKKLVLDQEKSKESLAQIYEKEYVAQQAALDPENAEKEEKDPELHSEINSMMKSLFTKLDALSNFHFTPKPAVPDLKIISNLPAISMEEVAPVATSSAALLAPEEIKAKPKGDVMGKNERTAADKKRERRKKKLKQKIHAKKLKPGLGNKYTKEKTKKMMDKVSKEKNVDRMDETTGNRSVKSSRAFFSQLQEEVKSQVKRKASETQNKKTAVKAKTLKL